MKYRISQLLCKLLRYSIARLRAAWILVCTAVIFSPALVSPLLAHAELSDISRIFRQTPTLSQFEVCQGGGCVMTSKISLSEIEWNAVTRIFVLPAKNSDEERQKIAQAIGALEDIVGKKIGTSADLAGTFFDGKLAGQQDCNDEAINSTTYMRLLKKHGLIQLHEIEDMRTRNFFFTGWPHTTAVIRELKTAERYAVDSWFYNNGHAATIVTFKQWKANFQPEDSPINRPKSAQKATNQNSVTDLKPVSR